MDPDAGSFSISPAQGGLGTQRYLDNTNILETQFTDKDGNSFSVTDFMPRYEQYGRFYRPVQMIRIVRPIKGHATIRVTCKPVKGWEKEPLEYRRGNSHVRYVGLSDELRLTTNMPLTYFVDEKEFAITKPLYFVLSWGSPILEDLEYVCLTALNKTERYWRLWVKHCSIPTHFQNEVIRSALTLKLHCYEDTGAILAAITTSLPEEVGHERNWDYRYCWLRDAYFTVSAFYKLGHFEELEGILSFLFNVLQKADVKNLSPLYRIDGSLPLPEVELPNWAGFQKSAPVRVGNQAAEHIQNDVYGEMLMTICPIYFDERFRDLRNKEYDEMVHILARKCYESLKEPDAGLWELRDGWRVHAFTSLFSWAGLERYERLISRNLLQGNLARARQWKDAANAQVEEAVHNDVLWNSAGDTTPDASLLMLGTLGYPNKKTTVATVEEVLKTLGIAEASQENPQTGDKNATFFYRYMRSDDFGKPKHAFMICTYWMIEALAKIGRKKEAYDMLSRSLSASNHLGLIAEHYDLEYSAQRGNFPQCYSHVGLIHAAWAVSPAWEDVL